MKIRFEHHKSPDHRIYYANGVFGGVTPRSDVRLEFFTEHQKTPDTVEQEILPDGSLEEFKLSVEENPVAVREVSATIYMNIDQAEHMAKWLLSQIQLFREAAEGQGSR